MTSLRRRTSGKQREPELTEETLASTNRLLTTSQAAGYLGTWTGNVLLYKNRGMLPYVKIGKSYRFRIADLDAFIMNKRRYDYDRVTRYLAWRIIGLSTEETKALKQNDYTPDEIRQMIEQRYHERVIAKL
jgi:excisionase family DNA binding protein